MKKLLVGLATTALVAATALSLTACGNKPQKVKVIDVKLTGESYGYCVKDAESDTLTQANELITALCGASTNGYDIENPNVVGEGYQYDLNGDGTAETVTFKTLYDMQEAGTLGSFDAAIDIPSGKTKADCLVVATNAEFPPFEYFDGNKFAGIDMWIAKMLAAKMEKTLVIKHMDFDVVITNVENGNTDIGMAGLTINPERAENVTFSKGYYYTSQRIAVAKGETAFDNCTTEAQVRAVIEGMGKVTAGAATGQTGYYYLAGSTGFGFTGFSKVTVKNYDSIGLAMNNLSNGKVKFVVGDRDTITDCVEEINSRI